MLSSKRTTIKTLKHLGKSMYMFWFVLLASGCKDKQRLCFLFLSRQDSEGVGQINQRANLARVLQQSLHKRRAYVMTVGSC